MRVATVVSEAMPKVKRLAPLALAVILPLASQDAARHFAQPLIHAGVSVHRNDDGSVKLGPRNEAETSNWSGYIVSNFVTGDTYSSGNASWTVPAVTYKAPGEICHTYRSRYGRPAQQLCFAPRVDEEYSSSWVGVGGSCEDARCARTDRTLIQLGTEQDVAADGTTQYYAWYELLPKGPVIMSSKSNCRDTSCAYPVKAGDAITASLTCTANCQPGQSQSWKLTLADATQNWTYSTSVTYASTLASAEWIQEAPMSNSGVLPLADYATATFDPTDDGHADTGIMNAANGTVGPDAVMMVDPYGETSVPSPVATLDVFAACWGNTPTAIASCPAP